jgi:predicted anti-sigma-YlaC factor YlaD
MTPHLTPETLIDYMHGELPPSEDACAHAHLDACEQCRLEFERESSLTELLRSEAAREEFELPPAVKARIRQAIRTAEPTLWVRIQALLNLPLITPAFTTALAIAVLTAGLLTYWGGTPRPTIDASFYLDEHAAQQMTSPLAERGSAIILESATQDTQESEVAASEDALTPEPPDAVL